MLRFYEEVWVGDNYVFADELVAPDYIRHGGSSPTEGPGEARHRARSRGRRRGTPADSSSTYDVIMAEGDLVAVRWTARSDLVGLPVLMRGIVGKRGPIVSAG